MMKPILIVAVVALAGVGCKSMNTSSDTESTDVSTVSDFGYDESWGDDITHPGPEHDRLDALVGEWDTVVKIWSGPQSQPHVSKGRVVRNWILGGRFVEEWIEEFDDSGDLVFQGVGLLGYDRFTGQYEYTHAFDGSTDTYQKVGRYDPARNVLSLSGKFTLFDSGIVILSRLEIAIHGPDEHIMTEYTRGEDGREIKEMEIRYTRRK